MARRFCISKQLLNPANILIRSKAFKILNHSNTSCSKAAAISSNDFDLTKKNFYSI